MGDSIGTIRFSMAGEEHAASLTDEGLWQCTEPGLASLLNETYAQPGQTPMSADWGRFLLYRVAARLGGEVESSPDQRRPAPRSVVDKPGSVLGPAATPTVAAG